MIYLVLSFNFILYLIIFLVWRNDCKEIGVEKLAVSLAERIFTAFVFFYFTYVNHDFRRLSNVIFRTTAARVQKRC